MKFLLNLAVPALIVGVVPLSEAAAKGCVIVLPLPDEVHIAIREKGAGTLRKWIAWNRETLNIVDPDSGRTPLMTALIAEKPKHFRILLQEGANPDATDGVGNTALHVAAQINEPWHVLSLLKAGANPNLRNAQGETFQRYLFMTRGELLDSKTRKGRAAVVEWLTAHGIVAEAKAEK